MPPVTIQAVPVAISPPLTGHFLTRIGPALSATLQPSGCIFYPSAPFGCHAWMEGMCVRSVMGRGRVAIHLDAGPMALQGPGESGLPRGKRSRQGCRGSAPFPLGVTGDGGSHDPTPVPGEPSMNG